MNRGLLACLRALFEDVAVEIARRYAEQMSNIYPSILCPDFYACIASPSLETLFRSHGTRVDCARLSSARLIHASRAHAASQPPHLASSSAFRTPRTRTSTGEPLCTTVPLHSRLHPRTHPLTQIRTAAAAQISQPLPQPLDFSSGHPHYSTTAANSSVYRTFEPQRSHTRTPSPPALCRLDALRPVRLPPLPVAEGVPS